jgi:hypothetical protein
MVRIGDCRSELPEAAKPRAGAIALVVAMEQLILGFGVSDEKHLVLVGGFPSLFDFGIGEDDGIADELVGGLTGGLAVAVHGVHVFLLVPCGG